MLRSHLRGEDGRATLDAVLARIRGGRYRAWCASTRRWGSSRPSSSPGTASTPTRKLVEAVLEAGHEVGLHGYLHEVMNEQDAATELDILERGLRGGRNDGLAAGRLARAAVPISDRSPELLLDHGFVYDASLMGDDQPYLLRTPKGDLVELPSETANDDWTHYAHVPTSNTSCRSGLPGSPSRSTAPSSRRPTGTAASGSVWREHLGPPVAARGARRDAARHAGARRRLGRALERDRGACEEVG